MKESPTEKEAEIVLSTHGITGRDLTNGFIDRLVGENTRLRAAITDFIRNRGRHDEEHQFDLTVCRLCDEAYVRAEAALDSALEKRP